MQNKSAAQRAKELAIILKNIWPLKKTAFDERLLNSLYRYALSLTHEPHQAYDLVQSCCEKILRKPPHNSTLKPFMLKVIRNQFIDQYRRKKLELVVDATTSSIHAIEEQTTLQELDDIMIDKQHVAMLLQRLCTQDRELLYLWAVEGVTMQELADQTNTPRGTLLSRLNRLKKRLKQEYAESLGKGINYD